MSNLNKLIFIVNILCSYKNKQHTNFHKSHSHNVFNLYNTSKRMQQHSIHIVKHAHFAKKIKFDSFFTQPYKNDRKKIPAVF